MCDTLVALAPCTSDGAVWFAKNSDREPGEAQVVEHRPRKKYAAPATLRCTHIEIPQTTVTNEVLISRPFWMWGAEMGTNEHGVAIGNEAVFTRLPYAKAGLTGMDLLRLALERSSTARAALDLITHLIAEHGQGGGCGYRNRNFRYHNAFIIADPNDAWVLETAGPHWVAERVRGIRTISNSLSIGKTFDLVSPDAYSFARNQGWCRSADDFDFARCYGDWFYTAMSGGELRRACTLARLEQPRAKLGRDGFFRALRDHAGLTPATGWRMKMPCTHASWWPTRQAGQTTGSMVSRLAPHQSQHWLTGTSSPCLSVFKPATLGGELLATGQLPGEGYDAQSLFWRHERLHRLVLGNYSSRKTLFDDARLAMQAKFDALIEASSPASYQACWDEHLDAIPDWTACVARTATGKKKHYFFNRYWYKQDQLDAAPLSPSLAAIDPAGS
jgi:secernin